MMRANVIFLCTGYYWIFFCVIVPEKDTAGNLKLVSMETREILEELNRDYKAPEIKEEERKVADKFNAVSEFEMYINCEVAVRYAIGKTMVAAKQHFIFPLFQSVACKH